MMIENDGQLVKVVVIDDHAIVREGLAKMLGDHDDIRIVGVARTAAEGVRAVESSRPQVVLLDLQLPDMHGLEVLPLLTERFPGSRVVVLTIHDEADMASEALRAGASGYVLKDASHDELVAAIRKVAEGGVWFAAELVQRLVAEARREKMVPKLTAREEGVLQLVAEGKSNREIGAALFLSPETVKTHVGAILRKLDATDRAEAVTKAFRLGLIT